MDDQEIIKKSVNATNEQLTALVLNAGWIVIDSDSHAFDGEIADVFLLWCCAMVNLSNWTAAEVLCQGLDLYLFLALLVRYWILFLVMTDASIRR